MITIEFRLNHSNKFLYYLLEQLAQPIQRSGDKLSEIVPLLLKIRDILRRLIH